MSAADNGQHRARWLQNVAHIQAEIRDLKREIDAAFMAQPLPPVVTMQRLAEADTHCSLAVGELDQAADRMRGIQ